MENEFLTSAGQRPTTDSRHEPHRPIAEFAQKVADQNKKLTEALSPLNEIIKKIENNFRPFRDPQKSESYEHLDSTEFDRLGRSSMFKSDATSTQTMASLERIEDVLSVSREINQQTARAVEALSQHAKQQALEQVELFRAQERVATERHREQMALAASASKWARGAIAVGSVAILLGLLEPMLMKEPPAAPAQANMNASAEAKEAKPTAPRAPAKKTSAHR